MISTRSGTYPGPKILLLLIVGVTAVIGCSNKKADPRVVPFAAKAAPVGPNLPVDFVLVVDNSRSIKPEEQKLIRATAVLLADLAEENDRISVVSFGQQSRVVVDPLMVPDQAGKPTFRRAFKGQLSQLLFEEGFSDIRAGVKLLAESQNRLFRPSGASKRTVVLLTDGKLESRDRDTRNAFDELVVSLNQLVDTPIYAVVLGSSTSMDTLLRIDDKPLTGFDLMKNYIAGQDGERFFHAATFDELLDIAVLVLKRSKGIVSLAEPGDSVFRIDDTVTTITIVVRKKTLGDGGEPTTIAQTADIEIRRPGGQPITHAERRGLTARELFWADHEYFDLIVIESPKAGKWEVTLADGSKPQVLSKVETPVELRYDIRSFYYLNETATATAWLFDSRKREVIRDPFRIQARLAPSGGLDASSVFVALSTQPNSGRYLIVLPTAFFDQAKSPPQPGSMQMELVVQRLVSPNGDRVDPWFIRRSNPITVELAKPFIDWKQPAVAKLNLGTARISLGGSLDSLLGKGPHAPSFDSPPTLGVVVEKYDEETSRYVPFISRKNIASEEAGHGVDYFEELSVEDAGGYRYRYFLRGTTPDGPVAVDSPWRQVVVEWGILRYLAFGLVLLFVLGIILLVIVWLYDRSLSIYVRVISEGHSKKKLPKVPREISRYSLPSQYVLYTRGRLVRRLEVRFNREVVLNGKNKIAANLPTVLKNPRSAYFTYDADGKQIKIRFADN